MINRKHITLLLFISLVGISIFASFADAVVSVKGYYRKNGTYVQPHYRSDPDSSPYNNWSYPGNTNPYTGKVAGGNSDTYLKNYNIPSVPSYSIPTISTPIISTIPKNTDTSITTISPKQKYSSTVEEWADLNPSSSCNAIVYAPNFSENDISKCNTYLNTKYGSVTQLTTQTLAPTPVTTSEIIKALLNQIYQLQLQLNALQKK